MRGIRVASCAVRAPRQPSFTTACAGLATDDRGYWIVNVNVFEMLATPDGALASSVRNAL